MTHTYTHCTDIHFTMDTDMLVIVTVLAVCVVVIISRMMEIERQNRILAASCVSLHSIITTHIHTLSEVALAQQAYNEQRWNEIARS